MVRIFKIKSKNCFGVGTENGNDSNLKLLKKRWDQPYKNNLEKIFDSYGINELEMLFIYRN